MNYSCLVVFSYFLKSDYQLVSQLDSDIIYYFADYFEKLTHLFWSDKPYFVSGYFIRWEPSLECSGKETNVSVFPSCDISMWHTTLENNQF